MSAPSQQPRAVFASILLLAFAVPGLSHGAGFQNLDFESPTFVPLPTGYTGSVDPAAALPGWRVFWGPSPAPFVLHDQCWLDSAGVSIVDTNTSAFSTLQGHYSVLLQGGFSLNSYPAVQAVSIAQTGQIPVSGRKLLFDASASDLVVSVAGQQLAISVVATNPALLRCEVDISRFAGSTAELRLTALPHTLPSMPINNVYIDNFRFTPLPAAPSLLSPQPVSGGWALTFSGTPAQEYTVQRASGLPYQWLSLSSVTTGSNSVGLFLDTNPPPDSAFYRVVYP